MQPFTAPTINYKKWNVYLDGILVQVISYIDDLDCNDVKRDLVYFGGFDSRIVVVRAPNITMEQKDMLDQVFGASFIKDANLLELTCLNTLLNKIQHIDQQPSGIVEAINREVQSRYKITQDARKLQQYIGK